MGKETLNSISTGTTIQSISISSLSEVLVSVPNLDDQKKIIEVTNKLKSVKNYLDNIENKISSNPLNNEQQNIIENILDSLSDLNEKVSPLMVDESLTHEFKASLRTPYPDVKEENKTGKQENRPFEKKFVSKKEERKLLEFQVLKSIAGFLNAQGGKLVIGVHEKR